MFELILPIIPPQTWALFVRSPLQLFGRISGEGGRAFVVFLLVHGDSAAMDSQKNNKVIIRLPRICSPKKSQSRDWGAFMFVDTVELQLIAGKGAMASLPGAAKNLCQRVVLPAETVATVVRFFSRPTQIFILLRIFAIGAS